MHDLIHINEALAGLPVDVRFLSFADVENGALRDVDVVINAGRAGDAWSGGDAWKSDALVAELTRFVHEGGAFIGVGEPSAVDGYHTFFRMANVLGIDKDTGARVCHGKWQFEVQESPVTLAAGALGADKHLYLTDGKAAVLHAADGVPQMTMHPFGNGWGVYMSGFEVGLDSTRMLLELLLHVKGVAQKDVYLSDNAKVETAYFPADDMLVVFNNAEEAVDCTVHTPCGDVKYHLEPMETCIATK
jgi:hypothetical protein